MKIGFEPPTAERVDDLVGAIDRLATAINDNTAALEARNAFIDCQLNGPRG